MTLVPSLRLARRVTVVAVTIGLGASLGACRSTAPVAATPTAAATAAAPSATTIPSSALHPTTRPTASLPTKTKTAWGTIWDALPAAFPIPPGGEPTETGDPAPASATLAIPATPATTADWYRTALPAAGYSVEGVSGPYENGGYVVDANGTSPDCRVQVSLVRLGTTTMATILFGAGCPFRG